MKKEQERFNESVLLFMGYVSFIVITTAYCLALILA